VELGGDTKAVLLLAAAMFLWALLLVLVAGFLEAQVI
jgi:hypothetical protein